MIFKYLAKNALNIETEGVVEFSSPEEALDFLKSKNLKVISLVRVKERQSNKSFSAFDKVSTKEMVNFSRQMSALLEAGVPVLKAFQLIANDTEKLYFKSILESVAEDIKSGKSISESMNKQNTVFSDFYVSMIRSGEESGKMNGAFAYLSEYLDRSYSLTMKVRNSMIYPVFVILTFLVVMMLVFTVVIPKLSSILLDSNVELPLITQIVLSISNFLVNYGIYMLVAFVLFSVYFAMNLKNTNGVKKYIEDLELKIPLINKLFKMLYVTRIADNIQTLLASGVSLTKSISITAEVVGNNQYKTLLSQALQDVRSGITFSDSMAKNPILIPTTMVQMIRIGEETGEVGKLLGNVAKFYKREIDSTIDTLVGLIEPIMIVLLGLGVGLLLVSVLLPIYNLASAF